MQLQRIQEQFYDVPEIPENLTAFFFDNEDIDEELIKGYYTDFTNIMKTVYENLKETYEEIIRSIKLLPNQQPKIDMQANPGTSFGKME